MPRESVASAVKQINAVMHYLQRIQKTAGFKLAMEKQTASLKEHMNNSIFGPADAEAARDALESAMAWKHFPAHLKEELESKMDERSAVHALSSRSKSGMSVSNKTQDWEACWTCLPAELYEKIRGNIPVRDRMNLVFQWLAGDGLRSPSEKTYQTILGIHYFFHGAMPECPWENYNNVQDVKTQFKAYVSMLPAPANWSWSMQRAIRSDGLTNCVNLEVATFMQIVGMIPIRSSDARLKNSSMQAHAQMTFGRRSSAPNLNLMLTGSKNESDDAVDTGAVMVQPNTKVIKLRNHSPAVPALPALPAPTGDGAEPFEAKAKLLQTGDGKKRTDEPAAIANSDQGKSARRTLAEVTAEISDSCDGQSRKRQKAEKKTEQSAVNPSVTSNGSPKPKAKGTPPGGAKAKAQKPAEAKAKANKRPGPNDEVRKLMRTAPLEVRVRLYQENGCSKCVWKPGCTPSCWRYRGMEIPSN